MIPDIQTHPIAHLASGDTLGIQLYRFIGAHPGKKVYLQSNLHGSEVSGNVVLQQLITLLCNLDASQLHGEIWIVPNCNPFSANQRSHHFSSGRYNPYTGHDWNRIFGTTKNTAPPSPKPTVSPPLPSNTEMTAPHNSSRAFASKCAVPLT